MDGFKGWGAMKNEWINAFLLLFVLGIVISLLLYKICQQIQFPPL